MSVFTSNIVLGYFSTSMSHGDSDRSTDSSEPGMNDCSGSLAEYACPICLQPVDHKSYVDPCYHQFCFSCLLQWAEHRPSCPLCNGAINSIVRQDQQDGRITRTPVQTSPEGTSRHSFGQQRACRTAFGRNQTLLDADDSLGMRKRAAVYRHGLTRVSNEERQSRQQVARSARLLRSAISTQRCREWISRDLQVILNTDDIELVETLVISLMRQTEGGIIAINTESDSRWASLRALLGDRLLLQFLDEFCAFADSNLDIHSYDRYIAYNTCN